MLQAEAARPLPVLLGNRPFRTGLIAFGSVTAVVLTLLGLDYLLRVDTFPVRRVSFEGAFEHVQQPALAAAVMDGVTGNFFLLDIDAVRARAESVAWVHHATVRRIWPDGVHIRFSEQQLVARWGESGWVNADGEFVDLQGAAGPEAVPVLDGPHAMQAELLSRFRELSRSLAPLHLQIASLRLTPRHSWQVGLTNGLALVVGKEPPAPKIARLARVYGQTLAGHEGRIRRVDLRYTNGFSVEWTDRPGAAPGPKVTRPNEG